MKYKIMVLDIDGTLTNSKKDITQKTSDALIDYQKRGGKIALASGRPAKGVEPYAKRLMLDKFGGYMLSFNGGMVSDCGSGETIYSKTFPLEYLPQICDEVYKTNVGINTYQGGTLIAGNCVNEYTEFEARIIGLDIKKVDNFAQYVNFDVNKCLLSGAPEEVVPLLEKLKQRLDGVLGIFRSEPFFIEVVPKGIDKAASIDALLKSLGIKTEECIACGDGFNDISMIKYAGLGVAMNNACDEAKAAADFITLSNDQDGVANVVKEFTF